jgi:hypothetical protein
MTTLGEHTGWLVIFDRGDTKNWDEKIYWQVENFEGKVINVVGC